VISKNNDQNQIIKPNADLSLDDWSVNNYDTKAEYEFQNIGEMDFEDDEVDHVNLRIG
jgi:hypothetical protein